MRAAIPKTYLNVDQLWLKPDHPDAVPFTSAVFHAIASGETQPISERDEVDLHYVVKTCLESDLSHHFQVYGVVAAESAAELERLEPLVRAGTLSERDVTILGNIFSLESTTPFQGGSALGELNAKTAHGVLHGPSRSNVELHKNAFMTLSEWDGNYRFDPEDWRRFAKGIEDKVAPTLLLRLIDQDINEFARATLQMTRAESKESFPEGTRERVFGFLRMFHHRIPQHLGQDKFNVLCDRLLPTASEEERTILGYIAEGYKKQPTWDPEA